MTVHSFFFTLIVSVPFVLVLFFFLLLLFVLLLLLRLLLIFIIRATYRVLDLS